MYLRLFFLALFGFMPISVFAATYSFAESMSTDSEGLHEVVLLLSADTPVNALQGAFVLPLADMEAVISDGGSVVQFWIEHPNNKQGRVSFAGVIPGGFAGEAPVLRFRMKNSAKTIIFNKADMIALRHDGTGEPDYVIAGPVLPLPDRFASSHGGVPKEDTAPPQPFVPVIATDPALFEGKPFVSFGTKDEGSGIVRYEIAESDCGLKEDDPSLVWTLAESPALLTSTEGNECVYVRAIDKEGNARGASLSLDPRQNTTSDEVMVASTARNLYKSGILFGIIVVTLGGFYFWTRRRKSFSK